MAQDHEQYREDVSEFQLWLKALVEKVHGCLGRNCKLATEPRLSVLQVHHRVPDGRDTVSQLGCPAEGEPSCCHKGIMWVVTPDTGTRSRQRGQIGHAGSQ